MVQMMEKKLVIIFLIVIPGYLCQDTFYADCSGLRLGLSVSTLVPQIRPRSQTELEISFYLLSLSDLDTSEDKLGLTGWLSVSWSMSDVTGWQLNNFNNIESFHLSATELWTPDLRIENSVSDTTVIHDDNLMVKMYSNATVVWEPAIRTEVFCSLDMTYYPYDKHKCSMTLTSPGFKAAEVNFSSNTAILLDFYQANTEWDLETSLELQQNDLVSPRLIFHLDITRVSGSLGLTMFLPLVFMSCLNLLGFLLPLESGERAGYSTVMLLTVTIIVATLLAYIPDSKTIPLLGVYIWMVFILSCLCVACTCVTLWLHNRNLDTPMSVEKQTVAMFLDKITCTRFFKQQRPSNLEESGSGNPPSSVRSEAQNDSQRQETSSTTNQGTSLTNGHVFPPKHLPPVEGATKLKSNRVHPRSATENVAEGVQKPSWKHLAFSLDRLFLIILLAMSVLVNFVFLLTISVGSE